MSEKFWFLKRCDLFERLTPEQLRRVESRSRIREFPKGNPVYLPADQADGVLLLTKGRVKICSVTAEGKQGILTFIEPGEVFGELALFDEGDRDEYAEAVQKSTILLIPADEMQKLMDEHPTVSLGVTKLIGLRRKRVERRLKYLLFHSNRERLVHLLLELAEQYGVETANGVDLGIKLSHQDLANVIGATRETVTVLLNQLQTEGVVSIGRKQIVLTGLDRLAESIHVVPPPHFGRQGRNQDAAESTIPQRRRSSFS